MAFILFSILNISNFLPKTDSVSTTKRQYFYAKLDSLQNSKNLTAGFLGVSIRACKSNETIIDYNSEKALRPASTLKLVTTSTALGILGEGFRYETNLEYVGQIKGDTLFGNIIIRGSGDPSLGSWRFAETLDYAKLFEDWANKIKKLNIKVITGNIISNTNVFTDNLPPDSWQWGDIGNYFGASSFGLNINENLFKAHFKTGKISNQNSNLFKTEPFLPENIIENNVVGDKSTSSDDVLFYSAINGNIIYAKGKLPLNRSDFIVKGSIPNPPNLTSYLLKNALIKIGIPVLNTNKNLKDDTNTVIDKVKSAKLSDLCQQTNFESINLYAESFLKSIAYSSGKQTNTETGIAELKKYWEGQLINTASLFLKDGSGLSNANAIAAATMTNILSNATKQPYFTAFLQSIPQLGKEGTVKNIKKNEEFSNKFKVKTGTIEKVKAYSGYFTNVKNELFCFSIMANQFESTESNMGRQLVQLFDEMYHLE